MSAYCLLTDDYECGIIIMTSKNKQELIGNRDNMSWLPFLYSKIVERWYWIMELTREEMELFYVYGSHSLRDTHKRLGLACALMVDHITKKNACDLRNKLAELDNQLLY